MRDQRFAGRVLLALAAGAVLLAWTVFRNRHEETGGALSAGRITRVTNEPGLELDPALSPDGRTLAYSAGPPGRSRIQLRQLADGRTRPLTEGGLAGGERWPQWSADGTQIVFQAGSARWRGKHPTAARSSTSWRRRAACRGQCSSPRHLQSRSLPRGFRTRRSSSSLKAMASTRWRRPRTERHAAWCRGTKCTHRAGRRTGGGSRTWSTALGSPSANRVSAASRTAGSSSTRTEARRRSRSPTGTRWPPIRSGCPTAARCCSSRAAAGPATSSG